MMMFAVKPWLGLRLWLVAVADEYIPQRYVAMLEKERELGLEETLPLEYLTCFKDLWADMGIQMAILKGNEYALHDNLN
jgi:hypothetical protein